MTATPESALLHATRQLLDEGGVAVVSLSAVAERAGLSRVTLHRRGVTVRQLVAAVVEEAAGDLRAALWPALTGPGTAVDRLSAALVRLCEVVEDNAGVLAALYDTPADGGAVGGDPGAGSFDFAQPFERLLRDGVIDRTLASDDPAGDADLVVNAVTWTYLHMRRSHGWPVERAAAAAVPLIIRSFTPGPVPVAATGRDTEEADL